jgi:hypothetical protein
MNPLRTEIPKVDAEVTPVPRPKWETAMNDLDEERDARTDDELLRAYRDPEYDDDGRALLTILRRHLDFVVRGLAAEGLSVSASDDRVGAVFLRALNREVVDRPLAAMLAEESRAVAHDPVWQTVS